ncbi:MAG TPA: diacylglycerol kinase family lipid kinase [Erysipelotrichaceae bacterium]|jgi:diacylglycerol kinase (ATP)|nr:diacylglycerol kinase family lipid kinase [Erysipelotrichia bacterium]HPX33119.1 diacylglycerol kinase family lipid kinase [Erysipelotrichaceae bacterium]HQA85630.1 diacylglycerol kinase family lipid kinase [Erysipelotrichaceae bacterium]
MKYIFIVNPTSGKGKSLRFVPVIENYFKNSDKEYEIIYTEYPKHATEIAQRYTVEDNVILYAVGGDGTTKEVLDGLDLSVRLGIIPGGTGNDFLKSIYTDKKTDEEIVKASIEGQDMDLDFGLFNGRSRFINIASFGLDAHINVYANNVAKKKKTIIPDELIYFYCIFKVGLKPEKYRFKMKVDGQVIEDETILVAISNGKFYGGMFNAFPDANLTDGIFDICYFRPMKLSKLIGLIMKYAKGTYQNEKVCTVLKGKQIHIEFDRELWVQSDGENKPVKEATIEMNKGKLKFRAPKFS